MAIVKWDPWREIEDMFDRYTGRAACRHTAAKTGTHNQRGLQQGMIF